MNRVQKRALAFLVILRLLVPFFIFVKPLIGVFLCIFADCIDYSVMMFYGVRVDVGKGALLYQLLDKTFDHYYYVFILIYLLKNFSGVGVTISIYLFVYRSIGLAIFYFTKKEYWLAVFQNFFEDFAIFLLVPPQTGFFSNISITAMLFWAILTKIPVEIMLHTKRYSNGFKKLVLRRVNWTRRMAGKRELKPIKNTGDPAGSMAT